MYKYRQVEFGLGGGGNWGLRNVEVSECHCVLALAHQSIQDTLVLPLKLTLRGRWMQEQLEGTLSRKKRTSVSEESELMKCIHHVDNNVVC